MEHLPLSCRLPLARTALAVLLFCSLALQQQVSAQSTTEATIFLRPHCAAGVSPCPTFAVETPELMTTEPLEQNSTLDIDIVITNPNNRAISRVRAWLLYNSTTLEGSAIDLGTDLTQPTPGERDFSPQEGYVQIDVNAPPDSEPSASEIVVARVRFTVKAIPSTETDVLSFFDVQTAGHTLIEATTDAGEPENILEQEPGSLLLSFATPAADAPVVPQAPPVLPDDPLAPHPSAASGSSSTSASTAVSAICGNGFLESGEECDDGNLAPGDGCTGTCQRETASGQSSAEAAGSAPMPDGSLCTRNADCASGLCSGSICRGDILKVEDDGACIADSNCISQFCDGETCAIRTASSSSTRSALGSEEPTAGRAAFALLQVKNLRLTTEGSSVYLAWDPLASSQLKAYNVYYGTTSGRYIQRQTISAESTAAAIRSLPEKTMYYFAIRALNTFDEESAFSQEVGIEIGNPASSTSPLRGDLLSVRNPASVQGDTGVASAVILLLVLSAVTGTVLASRRQLIALTALPRRK